MSGFIFSCNQSAMSLLIKTEYTSSAVGWLVSVFNYLTCDCMVKDDESLPDLTSNEILLDVCILPKNFFF